MAKLTLKVTGTSISQLLKEVELVANIDPAIVKKAMKKRVEIGAEQVRKNWANTVPWGSTSDFVYASISCKAEYSNHDNVTVYGSFGVYSTDSIAWQFGRTGKDITAAQMSWWTEYGTYRKSETGGKSVPFLANANIATIAEQDTVFINEFNRLMDKKIT